MSVVFATAREAFSAEISRRTDCPWDEWQSTSCFYFTTESLAAGLAGVSRPGVAGFALVAAEWVCARLWAHDDVAEVLEFLDAAWLETLGKGHCARAEFAYDEWQGPVRGSLRYAQLIAADTVFGARADGVDIVRACRAFNLAAHVIDGGGREAFGEWLSRSLERLQTFHPHEPPKARSIFDETFAAPDPVPPAAFCAGLPYDAGQARRYARDHLASVPETNKFLSQAFGGHGQ